MKPLVSVIMPMYNSESTVYFSIQSVLNQTYTNFELIVIDDLSKDDSVDIVLSIEDPRVKLIKLNINSGSPSAPRNIGLKEASGQYIAFLDSDDIWYENKLEVQIHFMESNNINFCCSGYDISQRGEIIASYIPPLSASYSDLLLNNSIGCLTVILNRKLLSNNEFPLCGHEDYALWLNILRMGNTVNGVQDKLACYNKVSNSVSSNKWSVIPFFLHIYRKEQGFSWFKSLYYCIRYLINVIWFKYK